jgi:hypothetical protein
MNIPTTPGTLGRRLSAISALVVTLLGLVAPAAFAGSDERIDVKYGYVRFDSDGDKLAAGDIWPDRRGVRARLVWFKDGARKSAKVTDGSAGLESSKHLRIREGTTVWLQLCYTKHGADLNCTRSQRAEA